MSRCMPTTCTSRASRIRGSTKSIAAGETDWRKVVAQLTGPIPGGKRDLLPEAHDAPFAAGDGPRVARQADELLSDPPSARGAGVVHQGRSRRRRSKTRAFRSRRRFSSGSAKQTGRVPPVLDAADVLATRGGCWACLCDALGIEFQEVDALLAARAAGDRRRLGQILVRRSRKIDRLSAVSAEANRTARMRLRADLCAQCSGSTTSGSCKRSERTRFHAALRETLAEHAMLQNVQRKEPRPDRQHQRPAGASRRGGRQPVRFGRARRRRGLGGAAALSAAGSSG